MEEGAVTSQGSMLTLARPACINPGFILHQQSAQHMKGLKLANPIRPSAPSDLASLLLCHSCHTFLTRQSRLLSEPEWKYDPHGAGILKSLCVWMRLLNGSVTQAAVAGGAPAHVWATSQLLRWFLLLSSAFYNTLCGTLGS